VDFLKINVFTHFGRVWLSSMSAVRIAGKTLVRIGRVFFLGIRPCISIMKLLAYMNGCPEQGNEKPPDKPVQNIPQYKKDENIHGRQI
jgi:hypothetical protein